MKPRTCLKKMKIGFHGFDLVDRDYDAFSAHSIMFMGITFTFCFGFFIEMYKPDRYGLSWTKREAHLQLGRREAAGLPVIDRNLVPAANITLPSEEELGDTNIIV